MLTPARSRPRALSNWRAAEILKDKSLRALPLPQTLMPRADFSGEATGLRFTSGSQLNAYLPRHSRPASIARRPKTAIREGFEILREYTDTNGKPLTRVRLGEQIDVHLRFRGIYEQRFADVALVDLLPGGFELVIPPQDAQTRLYQAPSETENDRSWACTFCIARTAWSLRYADPREDRVVFYGAIDGRMQEIVYRIRATNVGSYVLPPAYGEAMYDRTARARSAAGQIEVTRP